MERLLALLAACIVLMAVLPATRSSAFPDGPRRRAMKLDDLFRLKRVSDPQFSPDGKRVAYVVAEVDLAENKITSSLWIAPLDKGEHKQLTNSGKRDRHPRWSPDGKHILFDSNRSGSQQLWVISLSGGEARQLTTVSTGAGDAIWSPDGKTIAFTSSVWPEFSDKSFKESDALNKKKQEEAEQNPVKARIFTKLFFRHWDSYTEDKRQHLFVMPWNNGKGGEPKDITPGDRDFTPNSSTFSAGDDYTFSPDGKFLITTASPDSEDEAWTTNCDLLRIPVSGGKPENLTAANLAADGYPRFSPDGKMLAYRAQIQAGFEADRWQLYVVECDASGKWTGKPRSVTDKLDASPDAFVWSADGKKLLFPVELKARTPVYSADVATGAVAEVLQGNSNGALSLSTDGTRLAMTRASLNFPAEIHVASLDSEKPTARNVSKANSKLLAHLDFKEPESITVKGAGNTPMQMWLLKPPGFDETKKWPVAYLVHGGPQGAWEDGWSFRWCPQAWAARGYVVALPNPRGSTGFGQKYVNEISGDWGGKCYEDLMKGVDHLESLPWVDKDRMGAAGASFGGYMMNWFAVNNNRFKCLITHCSVWNFESMYATTDELWFDEWEHGGPPWGKNKKSYEKHSPHKLAENLSKFKTPMLVIHNDLDFRCPIGQGHELFTTLRRLRVPSRMVNFPDEGHWVLKPKNSEAWHKEVFAWLEKYAPPGGR